MFPTSRAPRGQIRADTVGDVAKRARKRAGLTNVGSARAQARYGR